MIYAKVKTDHTSEKDNYFLEEAELKIINYKGLIDIGITRAEFEDLRGDKMNDYNSKFKIEVRAHYKSSTDDLKVKNINSKQGLPKSKSLLLIDRRVRPMHLDVSKGGTLDDVTNKNAVALKNGIFDTEFFYRDGILENGEYYDRVSPKPEEWDDIVTHNIGLASPRCPRSRITII